MKFSIIIPVYNRENTITTCVEGVLNTDFQDFEVILINDGSSDDSLIVCQQLAAKYPRVQVITQSNEGVSAARNIGISHSKGEYLLFVDSDDTYVPGALARIDDLLENEYDLMMYDMTCCHYNEVTHLPECKEVLKDEIFDIVENKQIVDWLYTEYNPYEKPLFSSCLKLFKKSLLDKYNIWFREDLSLGEDQVFITEYLAHVETMRYVRRAFYCVLSWPIELRSGGLAGVLRNPQNFLYNQVENYKALMDLYHHSGVQSVKIFAVNYILDRPITRIVYRHLDLFARGRVGVSELKYFIEMSIKPVLTKEYENICFLRDKRIARYVQMVVKGATCRFLMEVCIRQNVRPILKTLRNKMVRMFSTWLCEKHS